MIAAYRQLAARCDYPLHLSVTEAGLRLQGTINPPSPSASYSPRESAKPSASPYLPHPSRKSNSVTRSWNHSACDHAAWKSCPTPPAGAPRSTTSTPSPSQVTAAFTDFPMGCVVNGPAKREADLGVSTGNGKCQIFVRGKVTKTVPEHHIVQTLLNEAHHRDWSTPAAPKAPSDERADLATANARPSPAHILTRRRILIEPALQAAVERLHPWLQQMVGFSFGWCDLDGTPTVGTSMEGEVIPQALTVLSAEVASGSAKKPCPMTGCGRSGTPLTTSACRISSSMSVQTAGSRLVHSIQLRRDVWGWVEFLAPRGYGARQEKKRCHAKIS